MRNNLIYAFVLVPLLIFSQSVKISTSADSIAFGEVVKVIYDLKGGKSTDTFAVDFRKIRNEYYVTNDATFEEFADVFVEISSPELKSFYDQDSQTLRIPLDIYQSPQDVQVQLEIKFLSYGQFVLNRGGLCDASINCSTVANMIDSKMGMKRLVVSLPKGVDGDAQINDIKPNYVVYQSVWDKIKFWVYLLLGLLLLAWLAKKYWKKFVPEKAQVVEEVIEPITPPDQIALEALEAFNKAKPWLDTEDLKSYHTSFTEVLRTYVKDRYGVNALEQTSTEILDKLRSLGLNAALTNNMEDMLSIADLVKFAKAKPGSDLHQEYLDKAIHFVIKTR